jgi:GR25 family glycosyltransferase involved in LPS biosynthesis
MNYIISILLIVIVIIFTFFKPKSNIELFDISYILDLYVITLGNKERLENIEQQQEKINNKIDIFPAVNGKKSDINELKKKYNIRNQKLKMSEIGCYLSHLNIYKKIKQDNKKGYTIIFEDDFLVKSDNLLDEVRKIITILNNKNIDFDFIFLGNLRNNYGKNIQDNIYNIDNGNNLFGTHGYVVNNKNIHKIIDKTNKIDKPIDIKIQDLSYKKILTTIVISPNLIIQNNNIKSTIR